ncbi:polyprenyl synthetase family protein [Streptomyces sp. MNP-20]|uniref:polyprenyl synthetase family protein n=1 Tax=Streptomyces sp. MNP-20 TaxID=2721165 RepID=UPI001552FA15|nr:polyprenyl synthetase family protein [Streptomyces sp. MNP-20]
MTLSPPALDLRQLRESVEEVLDGFFARKAADRAPHLPDLATPLQRFVAARGKRIRPIFTLVGWHAADGGSVPAVRHLAAALELFHAFALIHDDVMDRSDTRRGHPTLHRAFAHRYRGAPAAAEQFGTGAAILIGDLALVWSDELLHIGNPTPQQLAAVRPLLDEMRTELVLGQYLDLAHSGCQQPDVQAALTVIRYKTAKYTVERPLQLGAALAGADQNLLTVLTSYALPLGEAFQLRDDLLGVFGDPAATGKPSLDDLREGKATVLIALALTRADRAQADQLRLFLGCPTLTEDQAHVARRIITATGAVEIVETMISERYEQAMTALATAPIDPAAKDALRRLADTAVRRRA